MLCYVADKVDNIKDIKNPIYKIILGWCLDDDGRDILYKSNDEELKKVLMEKLGKIAYSNPDLLYFYKNLVGTPPLQMVDDVMAKMNILDAFISFMRHSEEGSKMVLAGHTDISEGDGDISFPQTSGFSQGGKLSGIGFCLGMSMLLIRINSCKELTRFVPMASSVRRVTR